MVDHEKYDCMETNSIYRITCKHCPAQGDHQQLYIGQSGRSMHARQSEHASGITRGCMSCPLVRHAKDSHRDQNQLTPLDFKMERVMRAKDNMGRLIGEGETIAKHEEQGSNLWNSKAEYGKGKLVRWTQTVSQI